MTSKAVSVLGRVKVCLFLSLWLQQKEAAVTTVVWYRIAKSEDYRGLFHKLKEDLK